MSISTPDWCESGVMAWCLTDFARSLRGTFMDENGDTVQVSMERRLNGSVNIGEIKELGRMLQQAWEARG